MGSFDNNRAREVIALSVPAILSQLSTVVMQYIDTAMVGSLGANATASVGLINSTIYLTNGFCTAATGGTRGSGTRSSTCARSRAYAGTGNGSLRIRSSTGVSAPGNAASDGTLPYAAASDEYTACTVPALHCGHGSTHRPGKYRAYYGCSA